MKQDVNLMKQLAVEEATKLKSLLTETEKENLLKHKYLFNPNDQYKCIYGMACIGCNSQRAIKLIHQCCEKVYTLNPNPDEENENWRNSAVGYKLNGNPKDVKLAGFKRSAYYLSPMETFINEPYSLSLENGFKIIDFLTDKTQTLEL